ncbi:MAG: ABC transporter ATP-binding protein/permease [Anaerolineae bacterium]|nr:ABC transporter ATP-binding protein/permease [Anaerolineae bacterium]
MWHYAYPDSTENESAKLSWPLVRRVLSYARPYRLQILVLLTLIPVQIGLELITPLILRDLIDYTLPSGDTDRLNLMAAGLVLIPILTGINGVITRYFSARIGEGVIYDLRRSLFAHVQGMSLRFFTHTKTGELMSRLNNDVVNAQTAISDTIVGTITNFIQFIAILLIMLSMEWRLTLMGLVLFPLLLVIVCWVGVRLRRIARESMDLNAQMNAMMNETLNISGALLVKLFGRKRMEIDRFDARAARVRDIGVHRAVLERAFWSIAMLIWFMGTAVVYWGGGHLVLDGVLTVGTIVAFAAYMDRLFNPLEYLTHAPMEFATSVVSFERVFEVVDLPLEVDDRPGAIELREVRGQLEFSEVWFRYEMGDEGLLRQVQRHGRVEDVQAVLSGSNGEDATVSVDSASGAKSQAREWALEGMSFTIQPGQLAAVVGPSGAGKTTLTYLIPRLYDPTEGSIAIDGHDLRDIRLDSLAEHMGMVTQETFLFHDTIRTNLIYARLDATQAEIEAACKAANIHQFITELPAGYDTIVGERGYRLSGGEKQRIAIARVILKDPRILVLDEATSHLDSQSETLIQQALERIMQQRTSIVIAHRLSTILAADVILVMDRGRIVEQGQHADLLAHNGLYARLYETQFRREDRGPRSLELPL